MFMLIDIEVTHVVSNWQTCMCGDLLDIIEADVMTTVFLGLEEDVWNIQLLSHPANSASSELTHSLVLREEMHFWRGYTPTLL